MIGLPMLSGFIGEFLILSSTFTGVSSGWAIVATLGVILGAAYMLWLVQRLFYGPESTLAATETASDLRFGERCVLWPLAVLMLVMGLAPNYLASHHRDRLPNPSCPSNCRCLRSWDNPMFFQTSNAGEVQR